MLLNDTKAIKIIHLLIINADESENKKKYKMRMRDKI